MIDANELNGIVRVHAGGMQSYVKEELQHWIVEQLVRQYPEDNNGTIPFDEEMGCWEEMGWDALMFMDDVNIEDFNKDKALMRPLYIEGMLVGYSIGDEHQQTYQAMFDTFVLAQPEIV